MSKTIVFNNETVVIPDDLALKLQLLMTNMEKRDNELAQGIADVNTRVTNLDLVTGLEGLTKEIADREAGDKALGLRIDTTDGNLTLAYNDLSEKIERNTELSGNSMIQGENGDGVILPGMTLIHNAKTVTVRFQVPGDTSYILKSITANYEDIMSFRDRVDCMIWEKTYAEARGGYTWRNVIYVDGGSTDEVYFDGITSYLQKDGKLVIRGFVVSDTRNDWFGNRTNRGFRPESVLVVISADFQTIEKIDWVGDMGVVTETIDAGYGATFEMQRLDNRVSIVGGASKSNYSGINTWQNLNEKVVFGMRPIRTFECSFNVMDRTDSINYNLASDGGLRIRQAVNNTGRYFFTAGVQWATNDSYTPNNWKSLPNWAP